MKVLFIENRYKTFFWEAIAKNLEKKGVDIYWIVQNHYFTPNVGHIHKIPYPHPRELSLEVPPYLEEKLKFISSTDRIANYFEGKVSHYMYYYQKMHDVIRSIRPDLVIGESTLFHELIIIEICKKEKTLYINPSSSSYPPGRFSFYSYDTKTPLFGSNEKISNDKCDELIQAIKERKVIPDYMQLNIDKGNKSSFTKQGSLKNRIDIIISYLQGERYNTPSPLKKIKKDFETKKILKEWDKIGIKNVFDLKNKKVVLYPLQMQPEANLDVWGNRYRNQYCLVNELSKNLPPDWFIVIKPNPKSKYEMNEHILRLVSEKRNIIPVHSRISMSKVFDISDIVVTVTGTVAIECVLSDKPLGLLGPSIVEGIEGCMKLKSPGEIKNLISKVEDQNFNFADHEEKRKLIKRLVSTTHKGLISDPASNAQCMNHENIKDISHSIFNILGNSAKFTDLCMS